MYIYIICTRGVKVSLQSLALIYNDFQKLTRAVPGDPIFGGISSSCRPPTCLKILTLGHERSAHQVESRYLN